MVISERMQQQLGLNFFQLKCSSNFEIPAAAAVVVDAFTIIVTVVVFADEMGKWRRRVCMNAVKIIAICIIQSILHELFIPHWLKCWFCLATRSICHPRGKNG